VKFEHIRREYILATETKSIFQFKLKLTKIANFFPRPKILKLLKALDKSRRIYKIMLSRRLWFSKLNWNFPFFVSYFMPLIV